MSGGCRLHVVSPQFPCGAAWLANALLELGIAIPDLWGFDTAAEWTREADGAHRYVATHAPWRQTLASLRPGRRFRFREGIEARFSHAFPWQTPPAHRTVLMVRDPRDALYSEFRRQQRNTGIDPAIAFPAFTALPFADGPISQRDLLWLHLHCWLDPSMAAAPDLLRFEDCKADPVGCLAQVATWVGIDVPHSELERAALASDVSHLQAIEARLMCESPQARQFNRRGQAYEWSTLWPATWHDCLGAHWRAPLSRLGYAPPQVDADTPTGFDTAAVLRWRELAAGTGFDAWHECIDAARIAARQPVRPVDA